MKNYTIIVAGGSGTRFGSVVPKQFVPLAGRPVLMRTIERFASFYSTHAAVSGEIIVVLPKAHFDTWRSLCDEYGFAVAHRLVAGGQTRFHSVLNGLNAITDADAGAVVAIHDGVRPLVPMRVIEAAFDAARETGAAIPVVPVTDSVRMLDACGHSQALMRSALRAVQTPQAFGLDVLREAYRQPYDDAFTDDASVVESAGHEVCLIEGDVRNIKITNSSDLRVAEMLMNDG